MRFTLNYRGPLHSRGNTKQKHELRRALHPQLQELWTHKPLEHYAAEWLNPSHDGGETNCSLRKVGDHRFAVIVAARHQLLAELDLLLLRAENPGAILQNADIDNRLKTLFDALRCPDNAQEVPAGWTPTANEQPLHCLLDDDRLISRINVDTDRLLDPRHPDEVALTIRVRLRASSPTWLSAGLLT